MPGDDLLRNTKFVKLTAVAELGYAELIQKTLRSSRVGAVIINDEAFQARPEQMRAGALHDGEGFRIEVPEALLPRALEVLSEIRRAQEG